MVGSSADCLSAGKIVVDEIENDGTFDLGRSCVDDFLYLAIFSHDRRESNLVDACMHVPLNHVC